MSAYQKLFFILSSFGMKDEEINMLLGRFLEETADDYAECMSLLKEQIAKKEVLFS